ncbi:MAG: CBS domain-containing protein [Propionivibrio sp.]|jgi:CBS domain-containing protein|uniref:CBS domain-containing protein n=1 Tax=Candidatus Propionivibrio dominans TaxID=2954373 RepID=A0A9D7IE61_9RHOO|nr:CBS domain-containing protein [Candidatus Propionivibrio dominans]
MNPMNLGSVTDIMKRRLITATPYETVALAAERMTENGLGALLVVENDRLVGIFSERDLLHRVVARRRDPDQTRLSQVLTPNPTTVFKETSVTNCIQLIRARGFRHLPVVNEFRNPIGIISSRDLLQHILGVIENNHNRQGDLTEILGPRTPQATP